jgi:Ni/Fe-hydrogenase subunit HybB-like protein
MWQGNSALFEVGMCVACYLTVLYIEFLPIVTERFVGRVTLPGALAALNRPLDRLLRMLDRTLGKVITLFIIAGVVLSCAHQSSLGTLMVLAPTKLHPLWHTTILPLLFLLSAFAVGLSMVIFESLLASRSLKRPFEMKTLGSIARLIPFLLTIYLAAKVIDLLGRDAWRYLLQPSAQSLGFWIELTVGVVAPLAILLSNRLRNAPGWLFAVAAMVVFGVALNRVNVFIIGFQPLFASGPYIPRWTEILLTVGFVSLLTLLYRLAVFVFPVLPAEEGEGHA